MAALGRVVKGGQTLADGAEPRCKYYCPQQNVVLSISLHPSGLRTSLSNLRLDSSVSRNPPPTRQASTGWHGAALIAFGRLAVHKNFTKTTLYPIPAAYDVAGPHVLLFLPSDGFVLALRFSPSQMAWPSS